MSKSVRELALLAIVEALGADGTPATGGVFRSRLEQIGEADLPCFDVSPSEEKIDDPGEFGDHGSVTRKLTVMVRALIDAATQEPGQTAIDDSGLDPFYVFAVQQLIGDGADLGGVVLNVDEMSNATVFQPFGRDIIGLQMTFEVQFATVRGNPSQKG